MDGEILDVVTEWGTRPVSGGFAGLYDLVDEEFSGAVTDGTAWAFVLNGRVVGVFDGDIEDFEEASLTAHVAPDVSLPLLYAMKARGGETRGEYYSQKTSLTEVDETLSTGNFVGYVELSENVLSGDYYVVYYGGRSLPVAYIGTSERLITGDEAFDRAADEVGIFRVVDAAVSVVDLPVRPGAGADAAEDTAGDDDASAAGVAATGSGEEVTIDTSDAAGVSVAGDADGRDDDPTDEVGSGDETGADDASTGMAEASETNGARTASTDGITDATWHPDGATTEDGDTEATDATDDDGAHENGRESDLPPDPTAGSETSEARTETDAGVERGSPGSAGETSDETVADLRRELDAARAAKAEAESARQGAEAERDELQAEVGRLQGRIAELEDELASHYADEETPERAMDAASALAATNLFVRYDDKSEGTLERAAKGLVDAEAVRKNLRLDHHTEFDAAGVTVEGRPFEAFLHDSTEYRFVEWLLTAPLFEIRRTDTRQELSKMYEALPSIDRIDLDGEVSVEREGGADTVSFDVVCRNKMGDPLFVADIDDARDPTQAAMVSSLLERSQSVAETVDSFAAACSVTSSFFDADAMEEAVDATRGGLFSRSSRRSYVKLSRKRGFHLCLVEARDEDFFLSVPDL